jgi:hypothetical protein
VEGLRLHGKTILKWILGKKYGKLWTGFIRLKTVTIGRLL